MLRSYRCALVAAFGWLSLAPAPPPDNSTQAKQSNAPANIERSLQSVAAAQDKLAKAPQTGEYERPCEKGKPNEKSDLCAQWYAANAARDAANWAFWSLGVGVVGALGIVAALWLTINSNRIARDTAKRQLRAYVGTAAANIRFVPNPIPEKRHCLLSIDWRNTGQTPAYDLETGVEFHFADRGWRNIPAMTPPDKGRTRTSLAPTCISQVLDARIELPEFVRWRAGERDLFIFASAQYLDAFGGARFTNSRWVVSGDGGVQPTLVTEDIGNDAT